ncbi:MAG: methyltransferase domain-containing protein [Parachlamydiales bacterium]
MATKPPPSPPSPCLGPLTDLESHLTEEWWRTLFNSVYLKTDADVVENQANTKQDIDLVLEATAIKPDARILDLCCGQGRHSLELASRGYPNIVGIDRSRYLVRLGRKRATQRGLTSVVFREGDARRIRYPDGAFDLVIVMGNSFGYFEREQENIAVLKEVFRLLSSEGRLFLDITDGPWMRQNFAPKSWEWIDQGSLVCRERHLSADGHRLISRELVVDAQTGVVKDQFYAERLYRADELVAALKESGFATVTELGNVQAQSTRACNDLGMMGNRLLLCAQAPAKAPPAPKTTTKLRKGSPLPCTVLLGDPRLPDRLKREGKFNSEDLTTVNKLREGLEPLGDYRFSYLDDHSKYLTLLTQHPPSFVFNLCDEGYRNDATHELHVPALLEMLGIPYSGGGPACLAHCYNKGLVRAWAKEMGIAVPDELFLEGSSGSAAIPAELPAFVKPVRGDSSLGITQKAVVKTADELIAYCDWLRATLPGESFLVQEYLTGREFSVALIGNEGDFAFLPILEVDYSALPEGLPPILGYESKWLPDSPYWTSIKYRRAALPEWQARQLFDSSVLLFQRLGCRDYARFDYRADKNGVIKLLEVNPNPSWCWDGKGNLMAEMNGWDYSTFLGKVLNAARDRLGL